MRTQFAPRVSPEMDSPALDRVRYVDWPGVAALVTARRGSDKWVRTIEHPYLFVIIARLLVCKQRKMVASILWYRLLSLLSLTTTISQRVVIIRSWTDVDQVKLSWACSKYASLYFAIMKLLISQLREYYHVGSVYVVIYDESYPSDTPRRL
jgi:hypothetical protein